jgi:hypothetical protein
LPNNLFSRIELTAIHSFIHYLSSRFGTRLNLTLSSLASFDLVRSQDARCGYVHVVCVLRNE